MTDAEREYKKHNFNIGAMPTVLALRYMADCGLTPSAHHLNAAAKGLERLAAIDAVLRE